MSEANEEDLLFKNVQDLRRRLQQTQQNLQSLSVYENGVQDEVIPGLPSTSVSTSPEPQQFLQGARVTTRKLGNRHGHSDIQGERGTSSTTSRQAVASMASGSHSRHGIWSSYSELPGEGGPFVSATSRQPSLPPKLSGTNSVVQVENETLRRKLHLLREENAQLISQNHKLQNELETASYQLHHHSTKIAFLNQEVRDLKEKVPGVEERLLALEDDNDALEKALQDADLCREENQRQLDEMDHQCKRYLEQLKATKDELVQEKKLKRRAENERDTAVQNVQALQDSLDESQRRIKDKFKKIQASEEHVKESLRHADREREELLERNTSLQIQMDDLHEELRQYREESLAAKDVQFEQEEQTLDLQAQLARGTQKIARLERESQDSALIRQENSSLRRLVDQQATQLEEAKHEISESHGQLVQLEEIASRLTKCKPQTVDESGMSLVNAQSASRDGSDLDEPGDVDLDGSYLETLQTKEGAHAASVDKSVLVDLRQPLSECEADVQRAAVSSEPSVSSTAAVESIKRELQAVVEKNKIAENELSNFESVIGHLREERTKQMTHIISLEERVGDLEATNSSLETRLSQRNVQVTDLQKEVNKRATLVTKLEREVRKKTSQISGLERQLDEKICEVTDHVSKVAELEEQVLQKTSHLESLSCDIKEKGQEISQFKVKAEKLRDLHREQMQEMENQIEMLEQKWEESQSQMAVLKREANNLRQEILSKDALLDDSQRELHHHTEQKQSVLRNLQQQMVEGTNRCSQLEGALLVCKEEISLYLEKMEATKDLHDQAIATRDEKIQHMEVEVANLRRSVDEKESSVSELLAALKERQTMLQTSNSRIGELEDKQTELEAQMTKLEHELHREQHSWQTEVSSMEKKLQQARMELEQRTAQIQEMTATIKELAQDKKKLTDEVNDLENQVHHKSQRCDVQEETIIKAEAEVEEMKAHLKEKSLQVEEQNDLLAQVQDELADRDKRITHLDRELTKAEDDVEYLSSQVEESHRQLEKVRLDLEQREEQTTNLKHQLRCQQDDLHSRMKEVDELDEALKERQWELCQRAAQVAQLDMTIKEHRSNMEQHVIRLEGNLKKTHIELQQKNKQISELDLIVERLQESNCEKVSQLQQLESLSSYQRTELETKVTKLETHLEHFENVSRELAAAKDKGLKQSQELRLAREEQQKLNLQLSEVNRELALSQREQEHFACELDEARAATQDKECEAEKLTERLREAQTTEAENKAQAKSELRKLRREIELMRDQHVQEVSELKNSHSNMLSAKEKEVVQLRLHSREYQHHEVGLVDELERARADIAVLEGDLFACKDVITTANETIVLKEAHIAHLEAKICERQRLSATKVSDRQSSLGLDKYPHQRSSSESSMMAPHVALQRSPRLVTSNHHSPLKRSMSEQSLNQAFSPSPVTLLNHPVSDQSLEAGLSDSNTTSWSNHTTREQLKGNTRIPAGNALLASDENDPDSFVGMLREVNQLYPTHLKTSSATTATLNSVRRRLLEDKSSSLKPSTAARETFQQKASSERFMLASNLTSSSSSQPVSNSFPATGMTSFILAAGGRENPKDGCSVEPCPPALKVEMPSAGGGESESRSGKPGSVEMLFVSKPDERSLSSNEGCTGYSGGAVIQPHSTSRSSGQQQQQPDPGEASATNSWKDVRERGVTNSVSKMLERLTQQADMVASEMEAQAASLCQHVSRETSDDEGAVEVSSSDDDFRENEPETAREDSGSEDDFREHEPETAVQRHAEMLDS